MYSPEEAAIYLGVHPQTVYKLLRTGELPGIKVGQLWRIPKEDMARYLSTGRSDKSGPSSSGAEERSQRNPRTGSLVTPKLWRLAGLVKGGPADLAEAHDRYLAERLEEEGRR